MIKTLCPICKKPLKAKDNSLICLKGHNFDKSKFGYTNLLMSNVKNSKDPGDNKIMVDARHNFLSKNFYLPLAQKITDVINDTFDNNISFLDAGVGTGYYLRTIIDARHNFKDEYFGVDISKHAVKIASKQNKNASLYVASVYSLPFEDKSFDVITCVFSPFAMDEYYRVLKDNGILIVVSPLENHLIEIRKHLYANVRPVETQIPLKSFKLKNNYNIEFKNTLSTEEDIKALLSMTPYLYRAPKDKIDNLTNQSDFDITFNFAVNILGK